MQEMNRSGIRLAYPEGCDLKTIEVHGFEKFAKFQKIKLSMSFLSRYFLDMQRALF
jgi:hypothetical protein